MNLLLLRRRAIRRRLLVKNNASKEKNEEAATAPAGQGDCESAAAAQAGVEEVFEAVLDAEASKHCASVLRAQIGHSLRVGVFNGGICEGEVVEISPKHIYTIHFSRDIRLERPFGEIPLVDLLVALPRPKTLNKIVQGIAAAALQVAATLGAGRLLLVCARRSERGYLDSPKLSVANIAKQIQTGLEQGVATRVPEVHVFASWRSLLAFLQPSQSPCPLHAAAESGSSSSQNSSSSERVSNFSRRQEDECCYSEEEEVQRQKQRRDERQEEEQQRKHTRQFQQPSQESEHSQQQQQQQGHEQVESSEKVPWCCWTSQIGRSRRLLAHPDATLALTELQLQAQPAGRLLVAVGPEGGWLPEEVQELQQQQGFECFHLGKRVLRCETAVVSILVQANMLLTDPTLRNGLPPPRAEGKFSARLRSESAAEAGGRSGHSGSSSCSSRSVRRREGATTPVNQAAGIVTRVNTTSGNKREDFFLSEQARNSRREDLSSPGHSETVATHRDVSAVGCKTEKDSSSRSIEDSTLSQENECGTRCGRGTKNKVDHRGRRRNLERFARRRTSANSSVSPDTMAKRSGVAAVDEAQDEEDTEDGRVKEVQRETKEGETLNEESNAALPSDAHAEEAAKPATAAERQNCDEPATTAAEGRTSQERRRSEIVSEGKELHGRRGIHVGRRCTYEDEDGFYIALPERRHNNDEQTLA